MTEENTKNKLKEIKKFGEEILPESLEVLKEIQVKKPKMSKIKTFEALFEIGEKKYLSNHPIKDKEFGKDFVRILNKTYMEYSCYHMVVDVLKVFMGMISAVRSSLI